jgi:hypothetical protein
MILNIHEFRGVWEGGGEGLKYPLPPYEILVKGYPPPSKILLCKIFEKK